MRMSQNKKSWIGAVAVLLALFVLSTNSWGQCTPGQKALPGWTLIYGEMPWVGDWVPKSIIPSGSGIPSDKEYAQAQICPNLYTCGWMQYTGWNKYGASSICPSGYMNAIYSFLVSNSGCTGYDGLIRGVCYGWKDGVYSQHDYDCDGIPDSQDANPATPDPNPAANNGEPPCDCSGGNPTNVATGNKYEEVLDLSISTPGIPIEFRRSYNSQAIEDGPLGYGWTHNFEIGITVFLTTPIKRVIVWDGDGRALYYSQDSRTYPDGMHFVPDSGITKDRLRQDATTNQYIFCRKQDNLTYTFGSDGKLLTISDPNGNTLTMTYTGGLLTQVSDNFGKSLSIQYTDNRISSVTDPKNQSILYEYTNGDLTKVTYPDQNSISYAYLNHNLTDKYDTNNNLVGHWDYDGYGRVITNYSYVKDGVPQNRIDLSYQNQQTLVTNSTGTTTYTTALIGNISVATEIQGCSTCGGTHKRFTYSPRHEITDVTSISDSDGKEYTTHYTYDNPSNPYDKVGEIIQMIEALNWPEQRTTSYTYTHRTDDPFLLTQSTEAIKSVVDPQQNKVITTTYDNQDNITSQQESGYIFINGVPTPKTYTTSYQYNNLGQLTQINGPRTDVSDITTFEYYMNTSDQGNNRGQLKAIVNALNQRTEFSDYDANGNVGRITDPNSVIIQRTYDERNRIKTTTNQTTRAQTQYFYDIRGNISYIILPEGNRIDYTYNLANKLTEIKDSLNNKIQYQYDVEGNRTREETKDPTGTLKKYLDFTYDAYNNLKRIINPDSTYTEYTYDGRKNRTASKDPKNNMTSYIYDALSRLTQMTQPLSTIIGFGYDSQDNQSSITDPNGNTTQYFNDDFGRRNQIGSPDTGTTDHLYDEAGNLIQRFDEKETVVNYTYDALNRLTAIQFPSDPNQNVTFTYDSTSVTYGIGQLTGRTDPSGSYTFYYDASGNLTKEDKTIGGILYTTQYTYNNNNFLTSITYPSGRVITYTPDRTGRISQVSTTLNGNPKTLASAITYLPYGGVTGLTYGNGINLTQGYDNQYRISSIVTGSILDLTFGYDSNGNVVSILDSVNPPGGEVFDSPGTYTYQAGTNKLTHIEGTSSIDFGYDANANITSETGWTYVYDFSNQLIRVLQNSNQVAEYTYNGAGQRIKKVTQTETRIFHYDPWGHLIAETNQAGQMLAEYIYLGDELLAMIKPGESVYYFHNDHLGTPQVLTDDTGTIAWKAAYTPFGEAVASIQTVDNPFRFPGQYYDSETGLHYNYFRYYNPQTGRYITPDPIGLEGGINLFVYLGDNPINAVDPLGLFDYCVQRRIGNKTTIKCSSSPTVYNLKEPAPFDPLDPYEEGQLLEPNVYILLPRTTWGKVLPTGSPVYTTPGQEAGTIITPTGKKRGVPVPAGPHIGKRSEGCPLFPDTKKGRKQKEEFYRHFKENIKTGGTWIVILDDSKGGLTNEY
jgi:RHS repeat-associated protein